MSEQAGHRSALDAPGRDVVLPAEGFTVATSRDRKPILVAHTGRAHLGLVLDRRTQRRLARAYDAAARLARRRTPDSLPSGDRTDPAPVIRFRHATAHELRVVGGAVHLTLHAVGDPDKPDVHVELRLEPPAGR